MSTTRRHIMSPGFNHLSEGNKAHSPNTMSSSSHRKVLGTSHPILPYRCILWC